MSDLQTLIEGLVSETTDAQNNVEEIETNAGYASTALSGCEDTLTDILSSVEELETENEELETERDKLREKLDAIGGATVDKLRAQVVLLLERDNKARERLHDIGNLVQNMIHDSLTIQDSFKNQNDNTDDS